MSRKLIILLAVFFMLGGLAIFISAEDPGVSTIIRNNEFFLESVRLTNLANLAFEEGDYEASYEYSMEAIRNANLSDEYVFLQLKIR